MRMGPGNDGPEPSENIIRAIRHGVAAGACRAAMLIDLVNASTWRTHATKQSELVRNELHCVLRSSAICRRSARTDSNSSSRSLALARTRIVTLRPTANRSSVTPEPKRMVLKRARLIEAAAAALSHLEMKLGTSIRTICVIFSA